MIRYILLYSVLATGVVRGADGHEGGAAAEKEESCPSPVTVLKGSESLTDYISKTDGVRFTFRLANYRQPTCEDFLKYRRLFRALGDQRKYVGHVRIEEPGAGVQKLGLRVLDFNTDENGKLTLFMEPDYTAEQIKPVLEKATGDLRNYLDFYDGMRGLFGNRINVGYQDPKRFGDPEYGKALLNKFATVKDDLLELTKSFPVRLDPRGKGVRLQEEIPVGWGGRLFRQVHVGLETPAAELQQTVANYRDRRSLADAAQRQVLKDTGLRTVFSLNLSEAEMRQAAQKLAAIKDDLAKHPAAANTSFLVMPTTSAPSQLWVREGFVIQYNIKDDPAVLRQLLAQARAILE